MRVYINMKRNYLSWMTTVLMAFACVAFISCDKDDDKDDGNGSGKLNSAEVGFSVNYGGYDFIDEYDGKKEWGFYFYNFDPKSTSMPKSINEVVIYVAVPDSIEGIPVGSFNEFAIYITKGENPNVEEETGEYYYGESGDNKQVTISNSDEKYTISFKDVTISKQGSELASSASFSYTGKLMDFRDLE